MVAAAVALAAIFALLAFGAASGWFEAIDRAVMMAAHGVPDQVALPVTRAADWEMRVGIAALAALLLIAVRDRSGAVFVIAAVAGGALFNNMLKAVFARPRPDLLPALDLVHSTSFPSGHSAGALVVGGALAVIAVRRGIAAVPAWTVAATFAICVGMSRVALAVHWPSDVVAGWMSGALWLMLCTAVHARWRRRFSSAI